MNLWQFYDKLKLKLCYLKMIISKNEQWFIYANLVESRDVTRKYRVIAGLPNIGVPSAECWWQLWLERDVV